MKLNWQATKKDMISFLYFDGFKVKEGRSPGVSGILFDAPTATFHQDNAYTDNTLHGLWKFADDRIINSNMFVSAKAAYFNTGFVLDPEGGLDQQAGRSFTLAQSFGSINQSLNVRPQHIYNVDANNFLTAMGASNDLKYGFGYRTADAVSGTLWPGNGILAIENSATDLRAQVFRQGSGGNRANYMDFYAGDTVSKGAMTLDLGIRYDRQWGKALPSTTASNPAFPNLVPGLSFSGYDTPFTWNNISPRAGVTYALDQSRKTILRASYSRYAGQLNTGTVGFTNPSSTAGSATYRWTDLNGDHFAQDNEVNTSAFISAAGGFNPANPTAVSSANVVDPNLKAPITQSVVAGIDRELMPNLALQVNYSYTRTIGSVRQLLGRAHAARRRRAGRQRRLHGGTDADGHAARRLDLQRSDLHPGRGEGHGGRQRLPADQHPGLLDGLSRHRGRPEQAAVEQVDGARRLLVEQRPRALQQRERHLRHQRQPDARR